VSKQKIKLHLIYAKQLAPSLSDNVISFSGKEKEEESLSFPVERKNSWIQLLEYSWSKPRVGIALS
jgi:hypothetical protein